MTPSLLGGGEIKKLSKRLAPRLEATVAVITILSHFSPEFHIILSLDRSKHVLCELLLGIWPSLRLLAHFPYSHCFLGLWQAYSAQKKWKKERVLVVQNPSPPFPQTKVQQDCGCFCQMCFQAQSVFQYPRFKCSPNYSVSGSIPGIPSPLRQVGHNEDLSRNPKPLASYWMVLILSSGPTLLFCTWGSSPVHKRSWVWSGVPNSRVLQHSAAPQRVDDGQGQGRLSPGQVDCVEWKTMGRTHRKTKY